MAVVTMITVLSMALTGCSNGKDNPVEEETTEEETIEEAESGTVALKVWGEEDTLDMLSDMVESFKEHYANEAEFEITLVAQADAETKGKLLSDVHNGADVFCFPDDQLTGLVAAGALVPVPNADEIRKANLEEAAEAATLNNDSG